MIGCAGMGWRVRLSGPVRLGIVIHAVWLELVTWSAYGAISSVLAHNAAEKAKLASCLSGRTDLAAYTDCGDGFFQPGPSYESLSIAPYLIAALAPGVIIVLGWFAVRWVRDGFRANPSN
jgi:hypothetical protein